EDRLAGAERVEFEPGPLLPRDRQDASVADRRVALEGARRIIAGDTLPIALLRDGVGCQEFRGRRARVPNGKRRARPLYRLLRERFARSAGQGGGDSNDPADRDKTE